jgi:hypothetical protein
MGTIIDPRGPEISLGDHAASAIKTIDAQRKEYAMQNAITPAKNAEIHTQPAPAALTPMEMVGRALEMGVSADILKQMMDLRDREESRNAKMAFTKAVAAAKAEIRPIMKTREVDYTPQGKQRVNYRHEDLAGIEEQVAPILARHGLHYRFESDNGVDRPLTITCILEHDDGHCTRTPLSAGADSSGGKNSLQAIASAATYLQRYTLKLALGLSVSHDDDGKKATETVETVLPEERVMALREKIESVGLDTARFCAKWQIDSVADFPASKYDEAISSLDSYARKRANG